MPSGHRPQPPVGTARVAISGHGDAGNPWVNVFWLNITATSHTAADLKSVIDSMLSAWDTDIVPLQGNFVVTTAAKASWLYAAGNAIEYTGSYNYVGTLTGSVATDSACYCINWSINDYYRGGHPRTYLAGITESYITAGRTIQANQLASVATGANNFITAVNALSHGGITAVELGTVRFASGNAWLSPPVFRAYNSGAARSVLATQRRRYAV